MTSSWKSKTTGCHAQLTRDPVVAVAPSLDPKTRRDALAAERVVACTGVARARRLSLTAGLASMHPDRVCFAVLCSRFDASALA